MEKEGYKNTHGIEFFLWILKFDSLLFQKLGTTALKDGTFIFFFILDCKSDSFYSV